MRAYNYGGSGRNLWKLYQGMWLVAGVITWTLILQWVPPTKFGTAKNVQNSARFLETRKLIGWLVGWLAGWSYRRKQVNFVSLFLSSLQN